ncbi:hypothetical protein HPY31_14415 [Brevibacillus sp. HB1.3]|uniref:hypothetical protein n=1 Tax=Brevibacillus sp. HB1.3 TaxID=2738842 RepID=UPI0015536D3E|nr:hypothetical protein [Brevibacillus sp. HB1.3]NQF15108.1 hypothetical protein [Brevibacillus sp. HB1.3]
MIGRGYPMLTPCIFRRGIAWILFFVLSLVIIPFFSDDGQAPKPSAPAPATTNSTSQP